LWRVVQVLAAACLWRDLRAAVEAIGLIGGDALRVLAPDAVADAVVAVGRSDAVTVGGGRQPLLPIPVARGGVDRAVGLLLLDAGEVTVAVVGPTLFDDVGAAGRAVGSGLQAVEAVVGAADDLAVAVGVCGDVGFAVVGEGLAVTARMIDAGEPVAGVVVQRRGLPFGVGLGSTIPLGVVAVARVRAGGAFDVGQAIASIVGVGPADIARAMSAGPTPTMLAIA